MLTATKQFNFCLAHMLDGHEGLCKNLHGHNYELHVTASSEDAAEVLLDGPSKGMVVDFKHLKDTVNKLICDRFDHGFVYHVHTTEAVEDEVASLLTRAGMKVIPVRYRPTAENMAKSWMQELNAALGKQEVPYRITRLRLYETPTSYAEVE